jgi:PAS domain S-box-containing protein
MEYAPAVTGERVRTRFEACLAAQNAATRVLDGSPRLEAAARDLVAIAGEGLGAALIELWWLDEETAVLCNLALWTEPSFGPSDFVDASRSTTFAEGSGLPGRVWKRREAEWIDDLAAEAGAPHASLARSHALASALACPVIVDGALLGVAVAAFHERDPIHPEIARAFAGIFTQLGRLARRMKTEDAHRRTEELFRFVVRATRDAIYDWHIVEDVVWRNETYEAIYSPDDPIGDGGDWWKHHLHPDDASRVVRGLTTALDDGSEIWTDEYRLLRSDGVYATVLDRGHILRDASGRAVRLIGAMTDITERARAEAALVESEIALRESAMKYRTLYKETPAMMHSIDRDGRLVSVSNTWLAKLGYTADEVIGRRSVEFLTPASAEYAKVIVLPAFFKNGETIDVLLSATAERVGNHIVRSLAILVDVTEKKHADAALRATVVEKEVLLKELHHRVKNNLQIISSLLSLQSQRVDDATARELFKESQTRVRAMALVHENLYRSQNVAKVDVVQLLRALTANVLRLFGAEAGRIALDLAIDDVDLEVETAIPCALLVNELLSNALKHAFSDGRKGSIRVVLKRLPDECVALSVADDGIGMPIAIDVDRADSLGLDIIKTLSGQLHGALHVVRDPGTRVELVFPRQKRRERG